VFCGLQNTPKPVFGRGSAPDPAGELMTLPQTPSRLEREHPAHTLRHLALTHLRLSPCVPQNSSQIYAYVYATKDISKRLIAGDQPSHELKDIIAVILG